MSSENAAPELKGELDDSGCVQDDSMQNGCPQTTLTDMPDDVLIYIFRQCSVRDLKALGYSCRRLCRVVQDKILWRRVDARQEKCSRARLKWLVDNVLQEDTQELLLVGYANGDDGCLGFMNVCREEAEKEKAKPQTDNRSWERVHHFALQLTPTRTVAERKMFAPQDYWFRRCSGLPSWGDEEGGRRGPQQCTGPQFTLSEEILVDLATNCSRLHTLVLEYCNIDCRTTSLINFPRCLKKLSLKGSKCYNMVMDKSFLFRINTYLPELESLNVSECDWMDPATLLPLSKLANLLELSAQRCPKMTEFVAYASLTARYGFRALKSLDLRGSPVGDSEISALGWLPSLEKLWLSSSRNKTKMVPPHAHFIDDPVVPHVELEDWEVQEPHLYKERIPKNCYYYEDIAMETNERERESLKRKPEENSDDEDDDDDVDLGPINKRIKHNDGDNDENQKEENEANENLLKQKRNSMKRPVLDKKGKGKGKAGVGKNKASKGKNDKSDDDEGTGQKKDNDSKGADNESSSDGSDSEPDNNNESQRSSSNNKNPKKTESNSDSSESGSESSSDESESDSDDSEDSSSEEEDNAEEAEKDGKEAKEHPKPGTDDDSSNDSSGGDPPHNESRGNVRKDDGEDVMSRQIILVTSTARANSPSQNENPGQVPYPHAEKLVVIKYKQDPNVKIKEKRIRSDDVNEGASTSRGDTNKPRRPKRDNQGKRHKRANRDSRNKKDNKGKKDIKGKRDKRSEPKRRGKRDKRGDGESKGNEEQRDNQGIPANDDNRDGQNNRANLDPGNRNNRDNLANDGHRDYEMHENEPIDYRIEPRHHVLYVNVGPQVNTYRFPREFIDPDVPGIRGFNVQRRHIESSSLVTDFAIRRFGRADGEDVNIIHIGPNGPVVVGQDTGSRPDRSNLRFLSVNGYRNITDRSLIHLATAAPHLTYVDFTETSVTESGAETFRSLRPDCQLIHSRYPDD